MSAEIKNIISKNKEISNSLKKFRELNREEGKILDKDWSKLSDKKIIELDKKSDRISSKMAKHYTKIRNYLVKNGIDKKKAHNFIMNKEFFKDTK